MSNDHAGREHRTRPCARARSSRCSIEKGLLSEAAVDVVVQAYGSDIGPLHGARVVARAWTDPAFKRAPAGGRHRGGRASWTSAASSRSTCAPSRTPTGAQPRRVHALLVLPVGPARAAARLVQVAGVPLARRRASRARCCASSASSSPPETEIRIWDSSADLRYIVLPQRPEGTDDLTEDELAALVTRESMIGTGAGQGPRRHEPGSIPRSRTCRSLPRRNGELVFTAPWQARAFGVAVALCEQQGIDWEAFRSRLIEEIGAWEREHGAERGRLGLLRALARLARAPRARARARGRRRGRGARRADRARRRARPRPWP